MGLGSGGSVRGVGDGVNVDKVGAWDVALEELTERIMAEQGERESERGEDVVTVRRVAAVQITNTQDSKCHITDTL